MMNMLRPLSTSLSYIEIRFFIRLLLLSTLFFLLWILCKKMGWIYYLLVLLSKVGFLLGARALSFLLLKLGCSGGLALAIVFAVKALLTSGVEPNMMNPSDDSSSAPSALEERTNELIQDNLKDRKGDLGDGQRVSEVRQGVEHDLNVEKKGEHF